MEEAQSIYINEDITALIQKEPENKPQGDFIRTLANFTDVDQK